MSDLGMFADLEHLEDLEPNPHHHDVPPRGQFENAAAALKFMHSGRATITLQGKRSRFTYKLTVPRIEGTDKPDYQARVRFVALMNGPDNERSYQYLGYLKLGYSGWVYFHGNKSKIKRDAASNVAFTWAYRKMAEGVIPADLQVWHEGRCGRCGRKLTVPESVASGFGPECINYV